LAARRNAASPIMQTAQAPHEEGGRHPSPRFQISMGTILILVTAYCVWAAVKLRPAFQQDGVSGAIGAAISFAFLAAVAIGRWKVFEKAGQPGWGAVVPIYNLYLLLQVARRPAWWLVLYFVPLLFLIPLVVVPLDIAKHFGKSAAFGIGLMFLGFIFYPILGFGNSRYQPATYIRNYSGKPFEVSS